MNLQELALNNPILKLDTMLPLVMERYYCKVHGSVENFEFFINTMKKEATSEEEFKAILNAYYKESLPINTVNTFLKYINEQKNFTDVVNSNNKEQQLINELSKNREEILKFMNFYTVFKEVADEILDDRKQIVKKLVLNYLSDKISFTIKETREELGFKNQRTFKKWLTHFYGTKFDNNRKFNLIEYIEVIQKFFLNPDENEIDLKNKRVEYQNRLNKGLVFNKKKLSKLTQTNYKELKNEIEELITFNKINIPENVDFFPYSIAQIIINELT